MERLQTFKKLFKKYASRLEIPWPLNDFGPPLHKDFIPQLDLRTRAGWRRFQKDFLKTIQQYNEKDALLAITDEMGIVRNLIHQGSLELITPKKYEILWEWHSTLQNKFNDFPHTDFWKDPTWLDKNLGKYLCWRCGADLDSGAVNKRKIRYCSETCRKMSPRLRKKRWRENHPDRHKLSQR